MEINVGPSLPVGIYVSVGSQTCVVRSREDFGELIDRLNAVANEAFANEPIIEGEVFVPANNPFGLPEGMHNLIQLIKLARTNDQAIFICEIFG